MPSSNRPPEEQDRVKEFNPLVLDRTVIALPLLKDMQEDLEIIAKVKAAHPEVFSKFNAAIEFDTDFPGGAEGARTRVVEMADQAAKAAFEASTKRLESLGEEAKAIAAKRHEALKEAITRKTIEPLQPEGPYCFARLHASVIRRLLAANERFGPPDKPGVRPIARIHPRLFEIIIDLNLEHPGGREAARRWVFKRIEDAKELAGVQDAGQEVYLENDKPNSQYMFARLEARTIQRLVELDMDDAKAKADVARQQTENLSEKARIEPSNFRAIFHIWPDFEISACINKSITTVKADAAQNSFSARGSGITWAVMDSGIEKTHPHFQAYSNIDYTSIWHKDFTVEGGGPFDDKNGHGTHVAGIIAGEWRVPPTAPTDVPRPVAVSRYLKRDTEDIEYQQTQLEGVSGMAPRCKLVSLRVLDENGKGFASGLLAAIGHVREINRDRLMIHGVNISLGNNFEPEWFACGQSPLCVEVDRLVKTGVVVVVAAGNTGYGTFKSAAGSTSAGMALTINDPGNSHLAITVGSTHREMPHIYGVSYFSSKGPTGDGRLKPDLVAPGEKIISCATGNLKSEGAKGHACDYVETSGTSMAAAHVSGAIAAFLSVKSDYIGRPEDVKKLFAETAEDLNRSREFQGNGLVDLYAALHVAFGRGNSTRTEKAISTPMAASPSIPVTTPTKPTIDLHSESSAGTPLMVEAEIHDTVE